MWVVIAEEDHADRKMVTRAWDLGGGAVIVWTCLRLALDKGSEDERARSNPPTKWVRHDQTAVLKDCDVEDQGAGQSPRYRVRRLDVNITGTVTLG